MSTLHYQPFFVVNLGIGPDVIYLKHFTPQCTNLQQRIWPILYVLLLTKFSSSENFNGGVCHLELWLVKVGNIHDFFQSALWQISIDGKVGSF